MLGNNEEHYLAYIVKRIASNGFVKFLFLKKTQTFSSVDFIKLLYVSSNDQGKKEDLIEHFLS
jgi:hypothetical protein